MRFSRGVATEVVLRPGMLSKFAFRPKADMQLVEFRTAANDPSLEVKQETDGPKVIRTLIGNYLHGFSKAADAYSRGLERSDRDARPRIGSKDARNNFWFSGSPPLIEQLIEDGAVGAAANIRKLLQLTAAGDLQAYKDGISINEKFRKLKARNESACKASYCSMYVLDESPDRVTVAGMNRKDPWILSVNRWGLD
jgi:hypothetical protein